MEGVTTWLTLSNLFDLMNITITGTCWYAWREYIRSFPWQTVDKRRLAGTQPYFMHKPCTRVCCLVPVLHSLFNPSAVTFARI